MPTISDKRRRFRALHAQGCFVLPNPWDIGTARYLQHLRFQALATTSSGAAFSLGLPDTDGAVPRDTMLAHIRTIVAATDLPVNADYESGYGHSPSDVFENVVLCTATGVAGLSIEDATGDKSRPLYEIGQAEARIRAARAAIDANGAEVVLTARAECFLVGRPDLDETIQRLQAYADAGADCLYAPGLKTRDQILCVVTAAGAKPVNVLVASALGFTVEDLAQMGVRRISLGSGLARAAWGGFMRAAQPIAEQGTFAALAEAPSFAELNGFFRSDLKQRTG